MDFLFCRDTYYYSRGVAAEVSFKSYMKVNTSAGNTDLYKKLYSRYLCLIQTLFLLSGVFLSVVRGVPSACNVMQHIFQWGLLERKRLCF